MKRFGTVKEMKRANAIRLLEITGREATEDNIQKEMKLYGVERVCGITAQLDFGVNATVDYIDGFGWAVV